MQNFRKKSCQEEIAEGITPILTQYRGLFSNNNKKECLSTCEICAAFFIWWDNEECFDEEGNDVFVSQDDIIQTVRFVLNTIAIKIVLYFYLYLLFRKKNEKHICV